MRRAGLRISAWDAARLAVCAFLCIMTIAPLAIVISISFSAAPFLAFPPPGLSLQWYRKFFGDPVWMNALVTSIEIMLPVSLLSTTCGTLAALAISRGRIPGASVLAGVLMAPLVVPVIITAVAIFWAFKSWGLHGTLLGLILAHTVLTIPFVLSASLASLRMVDPQLESAALTLGATYHRMFWRITFPLILPGIVSGLLFSLMVSFDELVVSLFISTPQMRPITVQMWSDVRGDVNPTIAAVATTIFCFAMVLLLLEQLLGFRARKARQELAARSLAV